MKQKKGTKGVSNYQFTFFEKKKTKPKFDSAYSDKPQIATSGTKHTVTTSEQNTNNTGPDTEKDWRVRTRATETNPEQTELWFTGGSPTQSNQSHALGPLTISAENMTDTEIDRIIGDAKKANTELHMKDLNGKVIQTFTEREEVIENISETTELELLSNLSSSTEIEQDTEENNLRR